MDTAHALVIALLRVLSRHSVRLACYSDGESHDALLGAYDALAAACGVGSDAISTTVQHPALTALLLKALESNAADTVTVTLPRAGLLAMRELLKSAADYAVYEMELMDTWAKRSDRPPDDPVRAKTTADRKRLTDRHAALSVLRGVQERLEREEAERASA